MPWYYAATDVMLLCSDHEGSPTSVKEALACNLPVVATDVGDLRQVMGGIAGTRLCARTASAIAQGLREVLTNTQRDAFRGREAMAAYDQAGTIKAILDVYRSVLDRPRPSRRVVEERVPLR
jgi:glycosyltransferase involved in cell wall biosynthesis